MNNKYTPKEVVLLWIKDKKGFEKRLLELEEALYNPATNDRPREEINDSVQLFREWRHYKQAKEHGSGLNLENPRIVDLLKAEKNFA